MPSKSTSEINSEIVFGIKSSLAAGLGMFPLGIAFGLLVIQSGLPWWVAPALSIAGFAGSLELLLVGLLVVSTPLSTIALTTLLVNFRHIFYAATFPLHFVRNRCARAYSAYALIDEAYAVTAVQPQGWTMRSLLSLQLSFQLYWVSGGLIGVLVGSVMPMHVAGLEFALCALFITLTLDACRSRSDLLSLGLAAVVYCVAFLVFPQFALFLGLLLFTVSLVIRYAIFGSANYEGKIARA